MKAPSKKNKKVYRGSNISHSMIESDEQKKIKFLEYELFMM